MAVVKQWFISIMPVARIYRTSAGAIAVLGVGRLTWNGRGQSQYVERVVVFAAWRDMAPIGSCGRLQFRAREFIRSPWRGSF
jgi:uncharacterized membrane protein